MDRPKLMRESDIRKRAIEFYKNSTDEDRYYYVAEELSNQYEVVSREDGLFVNGNLIKNPHWVVKEKFHRWRPYDTAFVIYHCARGIQVKFSLNDATLILDFCSKYNEYIKFYVKDEKLFGECRNPENDENINSLLESICSNVEKDPRMWYQGFYY